METKATNSSTFFLSIKNEFEKPATIKCALGIILGIGGITLTVVGVCGMLQAQGFTSLGQTRSIVLIAFGTTGIIGTAVIKYGCVARQKDKTDPIDTTINTEVQKRTEAAIKIQKIGRSYIARKQEKRRQEAEERAIKQQQAEQNEKTRIETERTSELTTKAEVQQRAEEVTKTEARAKIEEESVTKEQTKKDAKKATEQELTTKQQAEQEEKIRIEIDRTSELTTKAEARAKAEEESAVKQQVEQNAKKANTQEPSLRQLPAPLINLMCEFMPIQSMASFSMTWTTAHRLTTKQISQRWNHYLGEYPEKELPERVKKYFCALTEELKYFEKMRNLWCNQSIGTPGSLSPYSTFFSEEDKGFILSALHTHSNKKYAVISKAFLQRVIAPKGQCLSELHILEDLQNKLTNEILFLFVCGRRQSNVVDAFSTLKVFKLFTMRTLKQEDNLFTKYIGQEALNSLFRPAGPIQKAFDLETVKFLIKNGLDVTQEIYFEEHPNHKKIDPLSLLMYTLTSYPPNSNYWTYEIVKETIDLFLKKGANVNIRHHISPLHSICSFLKACIERDDPISESDLKKSTKIIQYLLNKGVPSDLMVHFREYEISLLGLIQEALAKLDHTQYPDIIQDLKIILQLLTPSATENLSQTLSLSK